LPCLTIKGRRDYPGTSIYTTKIIYSLKVVLPHACRVALILVGWSIMEPKPSRASQPYQTNIWTLWWAREVGVHPPALSLPQRTVTVIPKYSEV